MVQHLLILSAVLQWSVIGCGLALLLATLRLVGGINAMQHEITHGSSQLSLKGINVAEVQLHEIWANQRASVAEILGGHAALMILTDPSCPTCEEIMKELLSLEELSGDRVIVAVRGTRDVSERFAEELPRRLTVVMEDLALGLRPFKAPLATVLDSRGSYFGLVELNDAADVRQALQLLEVGQARERMIANARDLEEVGMVSSR